MPKHTTEHRCAAKPKIARAQVNYWGCYNLAKLLLPGMLQRGAGHLSFVSSMIYASPMVGYSSYAPSKAAVRHLADCLRSETQGSGVTVSVGYPPDTQTPGFDTENACKAPETKAISEVLQDHVYTADEVARAMFRGLKRGAYHLPNPDFLQQLALSMVAACTPRPQWLLVEVVLAPILVVVGYVLGRVQDRVVRRMRRGEGQAVAAGGKKAA